MGALLPSAILCFSLGLLLAFETKRVNWLALALFSTALLLIAGFTVSINWLPNMLSFGKNVAMWGCWASVIVTALLVQLPVRRPTWLILAIAANAGMWIGILFACADKPTNLLLALPCVFVTVPAAWVLKTPARLGVNIMAGWLVAVAIMAAAIPLTKTPGYTKDHIE